MHACMVKTQWSKAVVKGERATFKGKADCQRPTLEVARSRSSGGGWAPSGWASPREYRAAQTRQAHPEEVQEPS